MSRSRSLRRIPELVSPAGTVEKLKVALAYGADAVYFGGEICNLRARAGNLSDGEIRAAVSYVHDAGKRAYITLNAIPHNSDLDELETAVRRYARSCPDAFVVADPGVLQIVGEVAPHIPVHLSTQANAVNWRSVLFWQRQGISRVILAREMTSSDVGATRQRTDVELEVFVHGSMCISYSGRCLLSAYLTDRDANRGECAQPCRWRYALVEETHPGEYYPIAEDSRGTYILNSRDLCLLECLPELFSLGIDALKIEGRMKSVHYVAIVTQVYRRAIDACAAGKFTPVLAAELMQELRSVSHRPFTTGFWRGRPLDQARFSEHASYLAEAEFLGIVTGTCPDGRVTIDVRNRLVAGEQIEVVDPGYSRFAVEMPAMVRVAVDEQGVETREAVTIAHANYCVEAEFDRAVGRYALLRRRAPGAH